MIHKPDTISFTAFSLTAVLLIAFVSPAFAQGDRNTKERKSQETARQAEALFQNALLLSDSEDSKSTRTQLQEAMRLWMQVREPAKAAMAALQVGDCYKKARKYQDALYCYRCALDVKPLPGALRANGLNAIAQIYAGLYLDEPSARYFKQALDQARVIHDLPAQMIALTGLADLFHRRGALGDALSYITQALRLSKKDHADADPTLLYLKGRVAQEQGFIENAKSAFEEALAIHRKTGNTQEQVKVLCAMSSLSLLASRKEAALEQAEQAVDLAEKQKKLVVSNADEMNARESRWRACLSLARAERSMGLEERALNSYRLSIAHFKAIWWQFYVATEASAVGSREEVQAVYREYVDLLVKRQQVNKAYDAADEAKSRTLLNFIGARRQKPRSEDSKEAAALNQLSRTRASLRLQMLAPGLGREQRAKRQKEIEETESKMDDIRLEVEKQRYKERLVWSQPAAADQLQEEMAQAQMTLAEFSLGEKRSFLWLFTGGQVLFEILPARKEIETAVGAYLGMLGAPPNPLFIEKDLTKLKEHSETLFARLFGGLSGRIEQATRLIVVPDGLLHYLPFEALIHNRRYLVEDHEISYLPSASLLYQLQDSKGEGADRMELLAFGDPIFSPELKASPHKERRNRPIDVVRSALASRGFRLSPLPRTRDEVRYITGLFPPERTHLYLGKDSTEDAVKRESLRRYRRLHFATHSLVDEKSPSRSAVVLTLNASPDEDGLLEASEISELDLDCELVVLSACQTGRGQLLSGEGIVGLSRAFLYAGARAVVVSHWNVSDISTNQLMESFYKQLSAGVGNAAALRATKLQMLRSDKQTRHPYYWASFVIVGKP